jgi:FAD:protein FMN transferase
MMTNRVKNIIYGLSLLLLMYLVHLWREHRDKNAVAQTAMFIEGSTMGTTYHIRYLDEQNRNLKRAIDSVLVDFNMSMSTYIPESEISEFNRQDSLRYRTAYFYPVVDKSREIFERTNGAFDPTVGPLVNAWGFGPDKSRNPAQHTIDSLLKLVNFNNIEYTREVIRKTKPGVVLDFSAIAKGYGVDVVVQYLEQQNIHRYMVEIGGEIMCRGTNAEGNLWRIGIDNPNMDVESNRPLQAIVRMEDRALATSGNYRNYYVVDGKKYSHTISPVTGWPVQHNLLSASVFAEDCMTADAYATAFMVMGTEKAIDIAEKYGLDIYLIYGDGQGGFKTYTSPGIAGYFDAVEQ